MYLKLAFKAQQYFFCILHFVVVVVLFLIKNLVLPLTVPEATSSEITLPATSSAASNGSSSLLLLKPPPGSEIPRSASVSSALPRPRPQV